MFINSPPSYPIYSNSFYNWDSIEFGVLTIWELTNYQIEFDSVIVDFKMEKESATGKTSLKILKMMKDNESNTKLSEFIDISSRSIERNIDKLKQ